MAIKVRESDIATAFELELLAALLPRERAQQCLMLRAADFLRQTPPSLPEAYRRFLRHRTRD